MTKSVSVNVSVLGCVSGDVCGGCVWPARCLFHVCCAEEKAPQPVSSKKKGRARHDQWILREKTDLHRPDAADPTNPFKCLYLPPMVQRVAQKKCPLMEVGSWIVEDACT